MLAEKAGLLGFRVPDVEKERNYTLLSPLSVLHNTPEQTGLESDFARPSPPSGHPVIHPREEEFLTESGDSWLSGGGVEQEQE